MPSLPTWIGGGQQRYRDGSDERFRVAVPVVPRGVAGPGDRRPTPVVERPVPVGVRGE